MSLDIAHAIRAHWALAEIARQNIRAYLRLRKRTKSRERALWHLRSAKEYGAARNYFRRAVNDDIAAVLAASRSTTPSLHHSTTPT